MFINLLLIDRWTSRFIHNCILYCLQRNRPSNCPRYLGAAADCKDIFPRLYVRDDGSGLHRWLVQPIATDAASPAPMPLVGYPAVNYSIALSGYTTETFGQQEQDNFCSSMTASINYYPSSMSSSFFIFQSN